MANSEIPVRKGERPETTKTNPHKQLNQPPPKEIIGALHEYIKTLPSLTEGPSKISPPGARAFFLSSCDQNHGFGEGFIIDNEFVHIHPLPDGSLHLALDAVSGKELVQKGWGEPHVLAGQRGLPATIFMLYAPRDNQELEVAKHFARLSYQYAKSKCH